MEDVVSGVLEKVKVHPRGEVKFMVGLQIDGKWYNVPTKYPEVFVKNTGKRIYFRYKDKKKNLYDFQSFRFSNEERKEKMNTEEVQQNVNIPIQFLENIVYLLKDIQDKLQRLVSGAVNETYDSPVANFSEKVDEILGDSPEEINFDEDEDLPIDW